MRPAKIIVRHIERDRRNMALEFFAKRIGQPREASASHPDRKVAAFRVGGRNL